MAWAEGIARSTVRLTARRPVTVSAVVLLLVAALGVVVATSLGPSGGLSRAFGAVDDPPAYQPAHRGGTLTVLAHDSAGSIDPQINWTAQYWQLFAATYDGLLAFRQQPGAASTELVPDLATSLPQVQDGGRRYVFELRERVRFSDGRPVGVEDVVASLRRLFRVGGPTAGTLYRSIAGADACLSAPRSCTLPGVSASGNTVTITLTRPDPDLPAKLALPPAAVLPASTPARDRGATPISGTGAYRISSYRPGTALVMGRNPHFTEWNRAAQPAGYPDTIVERFGATPAAAVRAVRAGHADAVYDNPSAATLSGIPPGQVHRNALTSSWYLAMDVTTAPFRDVRARQAVNLAVDRARVAAVLGGGAAPSCTVLPPGIPGHGDTCRYGLDVGRARQLVTASGTTGQVVRLVVADQAPDLQIGAAVVRALASVGYRARLVPVSPAIQFDYIQERTNHVQISLTHWNQDYPSASAFLGSPSGCPSTSVLLRITGWCDPGVQARIGAASVGASAADPAAAARDWAAVDDAVMAAAPLAPLAVPGHVDVLSARTGNYGWSRQYRTILSQLWVW